MTTKTEIVKTVKRLVEEGKTAAKIAAAISVIYDIKPEEAKKLAIENGAKTRGVKRGITDAMYDFLAEKPRTKEELKEWIEENGTPNTARWLSSYDKTRELVNRVFAKAGIVPEEKAEEKAA